MATAAATKAKPQAAPKTQLYVWKGTDRQGRPAQGEVAGSSQALVKAQLRKQGIAAQTVKRKPKPLFNTRKKIKPADIAIFSRQLATMMKAGVPLVQSFDIVAEGLENPSMKDLVLEVKNDVASGTSLAASIGRHPKYFDELFCSLVAAGEQAGTLETMLDRIATYKEKTESLKKKIKKAMTYPAAVIVVAIVVTGILLVKVVPQFAQTFQGFGADLPTFTLLVMRLSEFMQAWWFIILIAMIAAVFAFGQARRRSPRFAEATDRLALRIPIIGDILYQSVIARFARTLSTTFAAGVPLVDALNSVAGAAGSIPYRDAIHRIREDVTAGQQLNTSIRATNMFPTMLTQMVSIGEESGALDDMLAKVATHYEESVDNMVDSLTALLEPMIMAVLGILVGGLMIAMYLPIFMLGSVI
jgi:type IV pilus assembly protein PilC